jgi:3-carboxy-cis,cis-muconate cycloisomerase
MAVRLIESLATTESLADVFSDLSILQAMLDFEVALVRVEARMGIIPVSAAEAIAAAAKPDAFDLADLSRNALRAGTPVIPFAKMLTEIVRSKNEAAAGFVHWGATSQDVSDTAMILLLKRAQPLIEDELSRIERGLYELSGRHKNTVLPGRTLLQAAPPVTFGLKAAGWFAAVRRGHERVSHAFTDALVIQFGGASGTLAALGDQGLAVATELATKLGLACPDAPWHTQRDRVAALVCACGLLTGSLGKIARDISLLMQSEVSEVAEPASEGRGGSSTMPHKRNPIGCAVTLAAANRMPGLVASYLSAMAQEHERALGGSQSEWPTLSAVMQSTGVAAASIAEIAEGLTVDAEQMRQNLEATSGFIYAEKATFLLAGKIGRDKAHKLIEDAVRKAAEEGRPLAEVLAEIPQVTDHLDKSTLKQLCLAEEYLGSAESFRVRQLQSRRSEEKD